MVEFFTAYGYTGIFSLLVLSGFGLPIPEELPVLTAGVLVGHGDTPQRDDDNKPLPLDPHRLRWFVMLPVCILGVVMGDGCLYGIGRLWGPRLLANQWIRRRVVPPEKRADIEKNFHDRGVMILLTARLTPGIRTPIFIMAGILRVPLGRFLLADGLYAIPGVSTIFFLAYYFTDQVLDVFHQLEHYRSFAVVGAFAFCGGILFHRFVMTRHITTGAPSEVPLFNRPIDKVTEVATHAVQNTVQAMEKTIEAVKHRTPDVKP